jgi:hypothetical protein
VAPAPDEGLGSFDAWLDSSSSKRWRRSEFARGGLASLIVVATSKQPLPLDFPAVETTLLLNYTE